jgi:hypothetical protein
MEAVARFEGEGRHFDPVDLARNAARFREERFQEEFKLWVEEGAGGRA